MRQTMKLSLSIFMALILTSCSLQHYNAKVQQKKQNIDMLEDENLKKIAQQHSDNKVLLLLPLSGTSAELGKGILNACILAANESTHQNTDFITIDTADRSLDKNQLASKYKNIKAIIGPVFFTEAKRYGALFPNTPVFTFSNNIKVNSKHIFACGLSPQDEINEIFAYARRKDISSFLIMLPKGNYGDEIEQYLKKSMKNFDFDDENDVEIIRYDKMEQKKATKYAKELGKQGIFVIDPILDISELSESMKVFTLSSNALQNREAWLGSVFAFSDIQGLFKFSEKYKATFGHAPSVLDMIGYDIVSALSESGSDPNEPFILEDKQLHGYLGKFTITKDNGLKRQLRLYESE